jgi:hypothetical protein
VLPDKITDTKAGDGEILPDLLKQAEASLPIELWAARSSEEWWAQASPGDRNCEGIDDRPNCVSGPAQIHQAHRIGDRDPFDQLRHKNRRS